MGGHLLSIPGSPPWIYNLKLRESDFSQAAARVGIEVEAVQGRYLFPVLAPLIAASIVAARELLPARARLPIGVAIGLLFVLGDFPYFLANASAEWFGHP